MTNETAPQSVLKVTDIIQNYNRLDLIKTVAALQLIPRNHGKNIRFELLANLVLQAKTETANISHEELSEVFENDFESHYLEDPVSSFFTENIIFYGGNYTVFPGINLNGTRILNTYLEGVFTLGNELKKEFKENIQHGVMLVLALSQSMADNAKLERYMYEEDELGNIYIPIETQLRELKEAVTFSITDIDSLLEKYGIPKETLSHFIISPAEVNVEDYNPFGSPLILKPIVFENDQYVFLLPTAVVNCLTEYIKKITRETNHEKEVMKCYFDLQWKRLVGLLYKMNWQMTDIHLPEKDSRLSVREAIFRFDNDKLAYVQLIETEIFVTREDFTESEKLHSSKGEEDLFRKRIEEVLLFLDELNKPEQFRYLTLGVLGETGGDSFFMWDKPKPGNQSLVFILADLEKLVYNGNVNQLTLWKFAKAHARASEKMRFNPFAGMLDLYMMYKNNWGSLLSAEHSPSTFIHIDIGLSSDFEREVVKKRDEHSVLRYDKNRLVYAPVKRHKSYAPIYSEIEYFREHRLLIENFTFPLWVINSQSKKFRDRSSIKHYIEGITFWLYKCSPSLVSNLNVLGELPIEVHVELDSKLLDSMDSFEPIAIKPEDVDIAVSVSNRIITISIPIEISHLLILSHNEGERAILRAVLHGFNALLKSNQSLILSNALIEQTLNAHIPVGRAKMILFIDSSNNMKLDNRWLSSCRFIEDTDTSNILDNIIKHTGKNIPSTPETIVTAKEKNEICNKIVSGLIKELVQKLRQYDASELLKWLIGYNEAYIQNREFREIRIPAKIACFSDFPSEVDHILSRNKNLVNASLSVRCLIEFIAADPQFGNKLINLDDLDDMIALMHEIIQWGMISDSIDLGIDDPIMEILPSGRIHVDDTYVENRIKPFGKARAENDIEGYMETFESKLNIEHKSEIENPDTSEMQEIDKAFLQEWGVTMSRIIDIKGILSKAIIDSNSSILEIEESTFITSLKVNQPDITEHEITAGLNLLCLEKRPSLAQSPKGFEKDDIYPWRYNRALSFIRKPIVRLKKPTDGKTYYYSGFRHLNDSVDNLLSLLFKGRLKAKDGGLLSSVLAKINAKKGDYYRNEVCEWLKKTSLNVIDYEVTISENGHLLADKDYGDIDILAIDEQNNMIYSIECKDTVEARVVHEMKTELDKYLGRNGNDGMIEKHVERHKWLLTNQSTLTKFVSEPEKYSIKSVVLSSQEIPVIYLAAESLPLPMLSYKRLKREGVSILYNI